MVRSNASPCGIKMAYRHLAVALYGEVDTLHLKLASVSDPYVILTLVLR